MVTLHEILKPRHVDLALAATNPSTAIARLAGLLQGDNRITNWTAFQAALCQGGGGDRLTVLSCGAALCHARTPGVASILMAAARLVAPVADRAAGHAGGETFRYIFVIGLPPTMASEYLRVVGALARMLKNEATLQEMDAAASAEEFVTVLSRGELSAAVA